MNANNISSLHNVSTVLKEIVGITNNVLTQEDFDEKTCNSEQFIKKYEDKIIEFIRKNNFEAFSDNPFPLFYKKLASEFPNAKFVLFKRDSEKWLNSVENYFGSQWTYFRRILYDSISEKTYWKKKYEDHNQNVINYFNLENINLLVIDLDNCENIYEHLCTFLNIKQVSDTTFPVLNQFKKNIKY